jgi:hypothetical protein
MDISMPLYEPLPTGNKPRRAAPDIRAAHETRKGTREMKAVREIQGIGQRE